MAKKKGTIIEVPVSSDTRMRELTLTVTVRVEEHNGDCRVWSEVDSPEDEYLNLFVKGTASRFDFPYSTVTDAVENAIGEFLEDPSDYVFNPDALRSDTKKK